MALGHPHMFWADEQFQTLEPASRAVFGFGWKSWEWYHGSRNWVVPTFYFIPFSFLKMIGLSGGEWSLWVARVWTAVFNWGLILSMVALLRQWRLSLPAQWVAVTVLGLSLPMLCWAPSTLSDHWAMITLWAPLFWVVSRLSHLHSLQPRTAFLIGILLSMGIGIRLQTVPWVAGAFGVTFWISRGRRDLWLPVLLGAGTLLFSLGLLDWITWGVPFKSYWANFKINVIDGLASQQSSDAWYWYFKLGLKDWGAPWLVLIAGLGIAWLLLAKERLKVAIWFIPPGLFFLAHLLISHKELRFVLPVYPLFAILAALGVETLKSNWSELWTHLDRKALRVALIPLLVGLSYWGAVQAIQPERYSGADFSDLSVAMAQDGGANLFPQACVALIGHYWIWGRGEMMMGRKTRFEQWPSTAQMDQSAKNQLGDCLYAVVAGHGSVTDLKKWDQWEELAEGKNGARLFKNKSPGY